MYTIKDISEKFNLNISTIRYYDKEGLLKNIKRENGIRKFDDNDINTIFYIECLKKSGMQLKEIKQFLDYAQEGDSTLKERLEMILSQKEKVKNKIIELEKVLNLLKYKTWYYTTAVSLNSEEKVKNISTDEMPEDIKKCYFKANQ